jgi:hypothetical protein
MMRNFRKPDLTAPRFRPKAFNVLNKELWKEFKEKHPKYKDLTYTEFKNIIKLGNQKLWEKIISYRDGVELPESLGFIFIGTCTSQNPKRKNINYGKSIKYGFEVSNNNLISDGKLAKIFYTNYAVKYKVKDREIWTFAPCRLFKRHVAKSYSENWEKYIEVPDNLKISKLYTEIVTKDMEKKETSSMIVNYNEFDLS